MVLEIPHIWWQILQISGDGRRHCSELHHFLFRTVKAFLQYLANIEVSWNWVPPNDQCLKVFSIINHPIWGTPIYGTPMVVFWFQLVRTRTWKEAKSCALLVVLKVWFRFQCFYSYYFENSRFTIASQVTSRVSLYHSCFVSGKLWSSWMKWTAWVFRSDLDPVPNEVPNPNHTFLHMSNSIY